MAEELQIARVDQKLAVADVPVGPPVSRSLVGLGAGSSIGMVLSFIGMAHPALALGLGGGLAVVSYVSWATFARARGHRFHNEVNLAVAAIRRGELEKARATFVYWSTSAHPVIRGLARYSVSWTLMLEGRVEEARTLIEDTEAYYASALARCGLLPLTRVDAGFSNALLGKLDAAAAWCAKAREPSRVAPSPTFPATQAIVEAVIACRTGMGLIHSRGHTTRGGYDGNDGRQAGPCEASAATVHG